MPIYKFKDGKNEVHDAIYNPKAEHAKRNTGTSVLILTRRNQHDHEAAKSESKEGHSIQDSHNRTVDKVNIDMERLAEITRQEVERYVGRSDMSTLYSIMDEDQKLYSVVTVPNLPRTFPSRVVVLAQVKNDKIIILEDTTDKPLVDALMVNGGIPREQIILAYQGEQLPESAG